MEGNFGIRRIHVFLYKGVKCQNVVGYIMEVFSVSQYTENLYNTVRVHFILLFSKLQSKKKTNHIKKFKKGHIQIT